MNETHIRPAYFIRQNVILIELSAFSMTLFSYIILYIVHATGIIQTTIYSNYSNKWDSWNKLSVYFYTFLRKMCFVCFQAFHNFWIEKHLVYIVSVPCRRFAACKRSLMA